MDSKKKYLIVKGSGGGGLGDRIRSVLAAIVYAKLTNRIIYIDWSDGKLIPQRRNVFYEMFQLKNIDYVSNCPLSEDVFPPVWRDKLDASLHDQYQAAGLVNWDRQTVIDLFSFDQRQLDYPQEILVMWEFDQLDSFSHLYSPESGHTLMRSIAAEHLVVNDQIANEVERFRQQSYLPGEKVIAVHIRATNEFTQQKNAVKPGDYILQIKRCKRCLNGLVGNTGIKIFLATDNSEIEQKLKAEFPGQLRTRDKWFADPGDKLHFNTQCPDADKSLRDALIEICLLADSEYLIYQYNSSFGMIADFFFNAGEKNIHALVPSAGLMAELIIRFKTMLQRWSY